MTDLDLVRAVLAFYDGKAERWTYQAMARNADLRSCALLDDDAVCWCLSGAANTVDPLTPFVGGRLAVALGFPGSLEMESWNDAEGRLFADVEARLRAAERRLASTDPEARGRGTTP